jgi:PKD repeat protein
MPLADSQLCHEGFNGQTIGAYECVACIDSTPVAYIRSDKNKVAGPVEIKFDSVNSQACGGTITSYTWDFGDGAPISGTSPTLSRIMPVGIHTVTLTITTSQGQSASDSMVVTVYPTNDGSLLLYLSMDDHVTDLSGQGHIARWSGAPRYVAGKRGKAVELLGESNPHIVVDHAADLGGMNQFSISLWAKKTVPDESNRIFAKASAYSVELTAAGFLSRLGKNNDPSVASGTNNTDWHHYVVTYDGTGGIAKIYLDKSNVATAPNSGPVSTQSQPLYIGHYFGDTFRGLVDEVRLYRTVLTQAEIDALFDQGDPTILMVYAGADMTVNVGESVFLPGSVEDDQPRTELTVQWELVSGPGSVNFANAAEVNTTAVFPQSGLYTLKLTVSDGAEGHERSDTVVVTVTSPGSAMTVLNPGFTVFKNVLNRGKGSGSDFMPVSFVVSKTGSVKLALFDRSGHEVAVLANEHLVAQDTPYVRPWDGKNSSGKPVVSGVYLLRLLMDGESYTKKVVVVR